MAGGRRIPLPREHGAWAMLSLSLLAGWGAGLPRDPRAAGGATLAALGAFLAQAAFLEPPSPAPARRAWLALEILLAALGAGAALWFGDESSRIWAVVASVAGCAACLWRKGASGASGRVGMMAWGAHLLAALALGAVASWVASAGGGATDPLRLGLALSSNFAAGVLLVRALRGGAEGGDLSLLTWSVAVAGAWCALGDFARPLSILLWLPLPARWILARMRPGLGWRQLGILETILGAAVAAGATLAGRL